MNKAILLGRLTRDPELRQTNSGIPVMSFTIAVDRRFRSQSGERQTDFISCQAWRQTAEFLAKHFQKGSRIAVVGSIQTGSYEKNGQTIYTTEVVVDEVHFADAPRDTRDSRDDGRSYTQSSRSQGPSWNRGDRQDRGGRDGGQGSTSWNRQPAQSSDDSFVPAPSDDTELPFDL